MEKIFYILASYLANCLEEKNISDLELGYSFKSGWKVDQSIGCNI